MLKILYLSLINFSKFFFILDVALSAAAAFKSVVGRGPGRLEKPLPLENMPPTEFEALELARSYNPTLRLAKHNEAASQHAITAAYGALLPSVSLNGDLSRSDNAAVRGTSTNSAFLGVSVSVPIYQAGSAFSALRQSRYTNSQQRVLVEKARRDLSEDVTQAWEKLSTVKASKKARADQVKAAKIALEGLEQELAVGSRTTLDVLDSKQELLDAQVAFVVAERDELVASFALVAAMGGLTADSLGLKVTIYDPIPGYEHSRSTWFGGDIFE